MYNTIKRVRTFETLKVGDELITDGIVTTVLDIVPSTPDRPTWRVYSQDTRTGSISLKSGTEDQVLFIVPPKNDQSWPTLK
jgi:hypothetical protein